MDPEDEKHCNDFFAHSIHDDVEFVQGSYQQL